MVTILTFFLDLGVLYSSDSGDNFTSVNSYGLANVLVLKLSYQCSTNRLFAWTHGRGLYYSDLSVNGTGPGCVTAKASSDSVSIGKSFSIENGVTQYRNSAYCCCCMCICRVDPHCCGCCGDKKKMQFCK